MTQLISNIDSPSVARAIKSLVKNIAGGEIVTDRKRRQKSGFDMAMDDIKSGRIMEYSSVKEMIETARK